MTTDRDSKIAQLLDRRQPPTTVYSPDWDDVLKRAQAHRSAHGLRPARRLLGPAALLAAAIALALTLTAPWNAGTDIVARAQAALAQPAGTVLHIRWRDTLSGPADAGTTSVETWLDDHGRFRALLNFPGQRRPVELGGTTDLRQTLAYDPETNTIGAGNVYFGLADPITQLRKQLATGNAHADGDATIDGRTLKRIRFRLMTWGEGPRLNGLGYQLAASCKPARGYLFVDPKTGDPVEYQVAPADSGRLVRRFLTHERLPATPATLRLTNIKALHPRATFLPNPPLPPNVTCAAP